jgi:hypothetical protein
MIRKFKRQEMMKIHYPTLGPKSLSILLYTWKMHLVKAPEEPR